MLSDQTIALLEEREETANGFGYVFPTQLGSILPNQNLWVAAARKASDISDWTLRDLKPHGLNTHRWFGDFRCGF